MHQIDPDILRRYWKGECTPAERRKVAEWLRADENLPEADNSRLSPKEKSKIGRRLWLSLEARISLPEDSSVYDDIPEIRSGRPGYGHYFRSLAAASAMLIMLALSYKIVSSFHRVSSVEETKAIQTRTLSTIPGQKEQVTLPDGSTIVLNGGSKLVYPEVFADTLREIRLIQGEVFFNVFKDPRRPFIVHTADNSHVKVLGTQFNIRSDTASSKLEVTLTEGQICFISPYAPSTLMRPGEQVSYDPQRRSLVLRELENTDIVTGWMQNHLRFDDTPLSEVLSRLRQLYGVEFEVRNGKIPDIPFTGTFRQEPLSRILSLMEQSTNLKFSKNGKKIVIEDQSHE